MGAYLAYPTICRGEVRSARWGRLSRIARGSGFKFDPPLAILSYVARFRAWWQCFGSCDGIPVCIDNVCVPGQRIKASQGHARSARGSARRFSGVGCEIGTQIDTACVSNGLLLQCSSKGVTAAASQCAHLSDLSQLARFARSGPLDAWWQSCDALLKRRRRRV